MALSLLAQGRTEETIATARQEPVEWSRLRALAIIYHESGREAESGKALRELVETLAEDGAFQIVEAQASRRSELCTSERMVFHRRYRILMAFTPRTTGRDHWGRRLPTRRGVGLPCDLQLKPQRLSGNQSR